MEGCPFCNKSNRIVKENDSAFLTYSLAPYHKHHLLVVPKRHITTFLEVNDKEDEDVSDLIDDGALLLEKLGYTDYSILVRNGKNAGKSIDHIHYHIIPKIQIGSYNYSGVERQIMTEEEIDEFMEEVSGLL